MEHWPASDDKTPPAGPRTPRPLAPGRPGAGKLPEVAKGRQLRLQRRDCTVLALLGLCRYLTVRQVVALGVAGRTEKGVGGRLRGLAGERARRGAAVAAALLRPVPFRSFSGEPSRLWGLAPAGAAVASGELFRELKALRADVGAAFAEHFIFLTDLFVQLVRPYLSAGVPPAALPFRWDAAEDTELPWRDKDEAGCAKPRVIRPDAVLEVPAAKRRFFIECEMGTHTLTPLSPDKPQATVRKLERYDAYVSGLADVPSRRSHYRTKYPDGWPCEVLFLVRSERRQRATEAALLACLEGLAGTRLTAHALTLEQATAHCAAHLAPPAPGAQRARGTPATPSSLPPFYGEAEHGAIKDFVLEMTAALTAANTVLRSHGLDAVPGPASRACMLDFLRKARAEMQRHRTALAPSVDA